MDTETIRQMILTGVPDSQVVVEGDGTHFEATIISPAFAGQPLVKRHQMVYAALGDSMRSAIHALSMRTLTPEEA
ncbi:MAG: BolA/IbaG family iron-sulfur metabolism protein [Gammaproteobacteria bacterium]|nr:MAG: BolA/IbaG family iron-sulfur metabolism protein [Gammaproteobacteria bacterium]